MMIINIQHDRLVSLRQVHNHFLIKICHYSLFVTRDVWFMNPWVLLLKTDSSLVIHYSQTWGN